MSSNNPKKSGRKKVLVSTEFSSSSEALPPEPAPLPCPVLTPIPAVRLQYHPAPKPIMSSTAMPANMFPASNPFMSATAMPANMFPASNPFMSSTAMPANMFPAPKPIMTATATPAKMNKPQEKQQHINTVGQQLPVIKAEQVFEDYCKSVLLGDGYLDAADMLTTLGESIDLNRLATYKRIKEINMKINSLVEVYWHTHTIRRFSELEKFIYDKFPRFLKEGCTSFQDLGVGNLAKVTKVQNFFGKSVVSCPKEEFKVESILADYTEFLRQTSRYHPKTADDWLKFLQIWIEKEFSLYGGAVKLNAKHLFYDLNRGYGNSSEKIEKEALRKFMSQEIKQKKNQMLESFNELMKKPSLGNGPFLTSLLRTVQNPGDVSLFNSYSHVKGILFDASFDSGCSVVLEALDPKHSEHIKTEVGLSIVFTFFLMYMLGTSDEFVRSQASDVESSTSDDIWESMRQNYGHDIPTDVLKRLQKIALSIVDEYDVTVGRNTTSSGDISQLFNMKKLHAIVYAHTRQSNNGAVTVDVVGTSKKKAKQVKINPTADASVLQPICAGALVYFRENKSSSPPPIEILESDVQSLISSRLRVLTTVSDLTVMDILKHISETETMATELVLSPVFACLHWGSFLSYLIRHESVFQLNTVFKSLVHGSSVHQPESSAQTMYSLPGSEDFWKDILMPSLKELSQDLRDHEERDLIRVLGHWESRAVYSAQAMSGENFLSFESVTGGCSFIRLVMELCNVDDEFSGLVQSMFASCVDPIVVEAVVDETKEEIVEYQDWDAMSIGRLMVKMLKSSYAEDGLSLLQLHLSTLPLSLTAVDRLIQELDQCTYEPTSSLPMAMIFPQIEKREIVLSDEKPSMDSVDRAVLDHFLKLLGTLPAGSLCRQSLLWDEYFSSRIIADRGDVSIFEFFDWFEAEIRQKLPESIFMTVNRRMSRSYDDIMKLPTESLSYDQLSEKLHMLDYNAIAASLMSALLKDSAAEEQEDESYSLSAGVTQSGCHEVLSGLRSWMLKTFESRGADALDYLIEMALRVCFCNPIYVCQRDILRYWLKAIGNIAKVKLNVIVDMVVHLAKTKTQFRRRGDELVQSLISFGLSSVCHAEFPALSQFAEEYMQSEKFSELLVAVEEGVNDTGITEMKCDDMKLTESSPNDGLPVPQESKMHDEPLNVDMSLVNVCNMDLSSKQAEVLRILQSEFHYDNDGNRPSFESPDARKLRESMELLSANLYSSDVHFVMELIQNADDNTYADGVIPTIKFELYPHAVVVKNNEIGFSFNNIVAVCNVGGSTKKGKSGYIGQKGIGFKSVFSVSDQPEIHSNGYHIKFVRDVSMLEPQWLSDTESNHWPMQTDNDGTFYETYLRLTLDKKAMKNIAKLTSNLNDAFDEKLILFLKKLKRMVYEDCHRNTALIEHKKVELSENWTEITVVDDDLSSPSSCAAVSSQWLIADETIANSIIRRNDVAIDSTVISLAFKFKRDNTNSLKLDISEIQPVYAYLPTSSMCFRFVVQADFMLSTNRESILDNNDWNQMLLEKIPGLFISIFKELLNWIVFSSHSKKATAGSTDHVLVNEQETGSIEELCPRLSQLTTIGLKLDLSFADMVGILPHKSHLSKVYYPVADMIFSEIQSVAFIPDMTQTLRKPNELLSVHHISDELLAYIPQDIIHDLLGKYLVLNNAEFELDDELSSQLHIEKLGVSHLITCLEVLDTRSKCHGDKGPGYLLQLKTISKLMMALCAFTSRPSPPVPSHSTTGGKAKKPTSAPLNLKPSQVTISTMKGHSTAATMKAENHYLTSEMSRRLKRLRVWPVEGRFDFMSLEDGAILFMESSKLTDAQMYCLRVFRHEIPFLDINLFTDMNKLDEKRLRDFLQQNFRSDTMDQKAGSVEELTADVVITNFILPSYNTMSERTTEDNCQTMDESPSQTSPDCASTQVDRLITAAYLGFIFNSYNQRLDALKRLLKGKCLVLPVLSAKTNNDKELYWAHSELLSIDVGPGLPQYEIHMGVEIPNSATRQLLLQSALRQLHWRVVDPLATVFACNAHDDGEIVNLPKGEISSKQLMTKFSQVSIQLFGNWSQFLRAVGVVNLFGHYEDMEGKCQQRVAPFLFEFLDHMLKMSIVVTTSKAVHVASVTEKMDEMEGGGESNDAMLLSINESEYVPVYLPNSSPTSVVGQLKRVSSVVQETFMKVVPMIFEEIRAAKTETRDAMFNIINALRSKAIIPVELHNVLSTRNDCFVASAVSVISSGPGVSVYDKFSFGPHCAYLHSQLAGVSTDTNDSTAMNQFYGFISLTTKSTPSFEFIMGYMEWMGAQSGVKLYSNIKFMSWIYKIIHYFVRDHDDHWRSNYRRLKQIIIDDKPLIWVTSVTGSAAENSKLYVPGRMYQLSRCVSEDTTSRFTVDGSPVAVIPKEYCSDEADGTHLPMFSRKLYCYACQAQEGMYGVRGKPIIEQGINGNLCHCKTGGFGATYSELSGLVKKNASMSDLIELLKFYRDGGVTISDSSSTKAAMDVWNMIGSSIWKCVHIRDSLLPYSREDMRWLAAVLQTEPLLPTIDGKFTTVKDVAMLVAIDDHTLYESFKQVFEVKKPGLTWINCSDVSDSATTSTGYSIKKQVTEAFGDGLESKDHRLESMYDTTELTRLPLSEFMLKVRNIHPATFFAPQSVVSLLRVLEIPLISDYSKVEMRHSSVADVGDTVQSFITFTNNMLTVAYCMLKKAMEGKVDGTDDFFIDLVGFSKTKRLQSLLAMKVQECMNLIRNFQLTVAVDSEVQSSEEPIPCYFKSEGEQSQYQLLLDRSIGRNEMIELVVSLLWNVFRIEIALATFNQRLPLMKSIETAMRKYARIEFSDSAKFKSMLEFDELSQYMDDNFSWRLAQVQQMNKATVESDVALENVNEPQVAVSEEAMAKLTLGFDRIKLDAKKRQLELAATRNMKAATVAPPVVTTKPGAPVITIPNSTQIVYDTNNELSSDNSTGQVIVEYDIPAELISQKRRPQHDELRNDNVIDKLVIHGQLQVPIPESDSVKNDENTRATSESNPPIFVLEDEQEFPKVCGREVGEGNNGTDRRDNGSSTTHTGKVSDSPMRFEQRYKAGNSEGFLKFSSNNSHNGRYNPSIEVMRPRESVMTLSELQLDDGLQPLIDNEVNLPLSLGENDQQFNILQPNSFTGRLGERIALAALQQSLELSAIQWINESGEQGLPFDIVARTSDGITKRIEVKARTSISKTADIRQWPITSKELMEASNDPADYICVLIHLVSDGQSVGVKNIHIIGLYNGLLESLNTHQSQLFVQV